MNVFQCTLAYQIYFKERWQPQFKILTYYFNFLQVITEAEVLRDLIQSAFVPRLIGVFKVHFLYKTENEILLLFINDTRAL